MSTVKNIFKSPVVYASDRSNAMVPVLFLFCVALWFILRGTLCFIVMTCSLSPCFVIPFSIVITALSEEELAYVLIMQFFDCFAHVSFCPCSLPLGVTGWLRCVIVALPGLLYYILLGTENSATLAQEARQLKI